MKAQEPLRAMGCIPCRRGDATLSAEEISALRPQVPDWTVVMQDGIPRLARTFTFPNFARALAFTDAVGALAEQEGHHPVITTAWGNVTVMWWTHAIGGLHRNDFIMAAKTDDLTTTHDA